MKIKDYAAPYLRELWRIVKDQIEEQSVVVVVMSRNSTIWRRANLKSVMRKNQVKYIDVEEMRVITNSKHLAEQIKIDKGENIVMDEQKIGKQRLKDTVMDGVKFGKSWKIGKLQN